VLFVGMRGAARSKLSKRFVNMENLDLLQSFIW